MGRPSRQSDILLRDELRDIIAVRKLSVGEVAVTIGFSRSTLHRALQTGSFSRALKAAAHAFIGKSEKPLSSQQLLHKSLHLLELSDKLRRDAERMISLALDQSSQTK